MAPFIFVSFIFVTVAAVLGSLIFTRHRERMTIIEKGLPAEDVKAVYAKGTQTANPLASLKWGIVLVSIGLAVLLGTWLHETYFIDAGLFPGLIGLFGGIGLVIFYLIARKKDA